MHPERLQVLTTWHISHFFNADQRCWLCGEEDGLAQSISWPECQNHRECLNRADAQAVFLRRVGFARPEQGIDLGEGARTTRAGYV